MNACRRHHAGLKAAIDLRVNFANYFLEQNRIILILKEGLVIENLIQTEPPLIAMPR